MADTLFKEFINLYQLSKTLRFELKPIGMTLENIKKNEGILQNDEIRAENYKRIKPILDKVHDDFIKESLTDINIDWQDFFVFYEAYKKKILNKSILSDKEIKVINEEFSERIKILRKNIEQLYLNTSKNWKLKYGESILKNNGYKILTESGILKVLVDKYQNNQEILSIIESFDGFFTYFDGFNKNRENYYTNESKSTEIITRIVDQNLIRFFDNMLLKLKVEQIELTNDEKLIFELNYYNKCLIQDGIDKYNEILGGKKNEEGERIFNGLNQKINEYNQKNKTKIPQLKVLYKQIGSIKSKNIPFDLIQDDDGLKEIINKFIELSDKFNPEIKKSFEKIFEDIIDYDKIWISKNNLSWISNKFFINWGKITEIGLKEKIFKQEKNKENGEFVVKIPEYINLLQLKYILEKLEYLDQELIEEDKKEYIFKKEYEEKRNGERDSWNLFKRVFLDYIKLLFEKELEFEIQIKKIMNIFDKNNLEHKKIIKEFADINIEVLRNLKLFKVDDLKISKYGEIGEIYHELDKIIQDYQISKLYDQIRNYITKKPYSVEKMKLNFNCSTLLDGWDKNKETQNLSVLLKDNDHFYLAIMRKDKNKFFDKSKNTKLYDISGDDEFVEKMEYKLIPGPNKMLPKCLMPGKDKKKYGATDEILSLYKSGTFKKGKDFDINSLGKIIDFYKEGLKKYEDWKIFDFHFKDTKNYEDISKFYFDVERQSYKLSWLKINKKHLLNAIEEGYIYLFEISSKDFQKKDKSSNLDLQTIYWNNVFQLNSNIKLNGQAEIFFRKASIEKINKNDLADENEHLNIRNENAVSNKRYTEDKILFHCPITLNFGSKGLGNKEFNKKVTDYIKGKEDIHIIGIDRGEKHLAFYSVINLKGEIIEQGTLNILNGVDYEKLLSEKAKNRDDARKNWETIGKIKELKEGYVSQVVRYVADLVLKYNAIVVLENLNSGFKNSRKKIEQSIYQNLELALAKKLSFLVNKNIEIGKHGSATNAYQLCPLVNNFLEIEKAIQYGIMFYTRANYTSVTDPITGFRKNIYLKKGKLDEMRTQILKFKEIGFNIDNNSYYFIYNPQDFDGKKGISKEWILQSNVDRYRGKLDNHGIWKSVKYCPTDELNDLFNKNGIIINNNILGQIKVREDLKSDFYSSLIWIIDLILQLRNTDENKIDYILSPIEFEGNKFDSRLYFTSNPTESPSNISFPTSGDANGAYNIARKGLLMLNNIKRNVMSEKNKENYKLYISDEDWDNSFEK